MSETIKKFVAFIREVFSENGTGSFARVIQGFIVLMTCGWVSYVVVRTRAIPDLGGPSLFVGTGAAHYGIGKMAGIVDAFKGKSTENVQNPPQNGQQ
jgi:hypothetical protein